MNLLPSSLQRPLAAAALCLAGIVSPLAGGAEYNDDAWSFAMEEALPEAKKDIYIREDFWSGTTASGKVEENKVQLFRGNTYWFWVGSVPEDTKIAMEVRNAAGEVVQAVDSRVNPGRAAICVKPERTGAYTVRVQFTSPSGDNVEWVLAYGYE